MKIILLGVFLFTTGALAATTEVQVDPVAQAISQQVQVTKQNLGNVIGRLNEINTSKVYNDPEYNLLVPAFRDHINQAMQQFDNTMTYDVLPRAQKWLTEFEEYATPNKDNSEYLNAAAESTTANLQVVDKMFVQAVKRIFSDVLGNTPAYLDLKYEGNLPSNHCKVTNRDYYGGIGVKVVLSDFSSTQVNVIPTSYCSFSRYTQGGYVFDQNGNRVSIPGLDEMADMITKTWTAGCHTDECKQLRLNDLINFSDLVEKVINKDVSLLSYLGHSFSLPSQHVETEYFRQAILKSLASLK